MNSDGTKMRILQVVAGELIFLGREGENNATQVRFGIAQWVKTYGEGRAELIVQRQNDPAPYPIVIERDGNSVVWTVSSADTAHPGRYGRAELRYYVGETLVKSAISQFIVTDALGEPTDTPPDPYQSWVDNVLDAAQRAEDAADRAENAGGGGAELPPGGTKGQVLAKRSDVGGDVEWVDQIVGTGFPYEIGHGLKVVDNALEVDAVSDFDGDNTLPITAAAVQATVGNIEILLSTI